MQQVKKKNASTTCSTQGVLLFENVSIFLLHEKNKIERIWKMKKISDTAILTSLFFM